MDEVCGLLPCNVANGPWERPAVQETHWDTFYSHTSQPDTGEEYMFPYAKLAAFLDPKFLGLELEKARFLIVGCGISALGEDLHDAFQGRMKEICSTDSSHFCIERLRQRNRQRSCMHFAVDNILESSLTSNSFDVVVDKGVLDDVLACSQKSPEQEDMLGKSPSDAGERTACRMIWEVRRLLACPGAYVIASVLGPEHLLAMLESSRLGFSTVDHTALNNGEPAHHVYVCRLPLETESRSVLGGGPKPPERVRDRSPSSFDAYVAEVIHAKYTEAMPMLTQTRINAVRSAFKEAGQGMQMTTKRAHHELFSREEQREYPLEEFLEDLGDYLDQRSGGEQCPGPDHMLSCETFLDFLQTSQ